jgi:hypothetical protein
MANLGGGVNLKGGTALGRVLAVAAAMNVAACVAPSQLAAPASDAEGKIQTAKPGLSRVYLVHGDISFVHGDGTAAAVGAGGLVVGLLVSGVANAIKGPATEPDVKPDWVAGRYYLDGQLLGTMGEGHYMVLDLPPGEYQLGFTHATTFGPTDAAPVRVALLADKVTYMKSRVWIVRNATTARILPCPEGCSARVAAGQRIAADWPPKPAATP